MTVAIDAIASIQLLGKMNCGGLRPRRSLVQLGNISPSSCDLKASKHPPVPLDASHQVGLGGCFGAFRSQLEGEMLPNCTVVHEYAAFRPHKNNLIPASPQQQCNSGTKMSN